MKKIKYLIFATMFLSSTTYADTFNYNFINIGLNSFSSDAEFDASGISVNASFSPIKKLAIVAGYGYFDFDFSDLETDELFVGVNFHTPVAEKIDFVAGLSILDAEISDSFGIIDSDTGNVINVGARFKIARKFEINAGVSRVSIFGFNTNHIGASAVLLFARRFHMGIGINLTDDSETIGLNFRIITKL